MTEVVVLILVIGVILGFGVGRWWGERQRARADMHKVWQSRRSYRNGPFDGYF
jgi:preprotein translocase subunit Sec63